MELESIFRSRPYLPKFGEIALSALSIALITGVLLLPFYLSAEQPFKSVSLLVQSGRFGHFLHSTHTYAADVFLLALFLHLIEYLLKKSYLSYSFKSWNYLMVLLLFSVFVVFSGFLAVGSQESADAQQIFSNVLKVAGIVGNALSAFLLMTRTEHSTLTILLHHVATFSLLTIFLVYVHLRRFKSDAYAFYYTLVLIALFAVLRPAEIGLPVGSPAAVIKGPWYFRGLQEMLAWLPVWFAGLFLPFLTIALLAVLPVARKNHRLLVGALFLMFAFYLFEGLIATFLRGAGWRLVGF